MRRFLSVLTVTCALAGPAMAADPVRTGAEAARDRALADSAAWEFVESLTTDVGPRVAGSEAAVRARDWALARLKALGFTNVHAEPFTINAWARGAEQATVISPRTQALAIIGLGGSVPTPPEGIEAEAVVFRTYADLLAAPPGSLAGKIAVVTQPTVRAPDGSGYGAANAIRRAGASEAARRGAVAYLHRSLGTSDSRSPHTGALNYAPDAPKIPAAALSTIDAQLLDRMAARGAPIRIRLKLESSVHPATAWNVVGDIVGAEKPDEMVVVGGHLDSWDPGTGAIDDGAGMAITVGGARGAALPNRPRRTLRVVLYGAEEPERSQLASEAYAAAHASEAAHVVAIAEADNGAGRAWSLQLPPGGAAKPQLASLSAVLAPLGVYVSPQPSQGSGSDTEAMVKLGAPPFGLRQDASHYFDWHHSAEDTLDKIDPEALRQNVAAWSAVLYELANTDVDFRAPAPAAH